LDLLEKKYSLQNKELCYKKKSTHKTDEGRVVFLKQTVNEIVVLFKEEKFISLQGEFKYHLAYVDEAEKRMLSCFFDLVDILKNELTISYDVFFDVFSEKKSITENFDMVELTLRRYFDQLNKMFIIPCAENFPERLLNPENIISDEKSRTMWLDEFGNSCYQIPFELFKSTIIPQLVTGIDTNSIRFQNITKTIEFFIHFPRNGIITPYSLNLLTSHWGPHDKINRNIQKFAVKKRIFRVNECIYCRGLLTRT